ncbi:hypothetical protein Emtol_0779 [Emticicia oligotrophica DSM 17448]|uniref:DUF5018 domain-containing protein n=1 Tax=Emticicia oligotrophica (strain DSM 17448 / CIP 109782 / MTCC 6937 / GPTSA100-15) TaxID=929562 RepID=A0ABM5MXR9_EMTOG|nr:hypothetical protein [Emticicia oligotrophica]AFK01931.1 hypothetical protein Emtol_0779 [Emticicia oligotrophica DSM 17448]
MIKFFLQLCCLLLLFSCKNPTEPITSPRILGFSFVGVDSLKTSIDSDAKTITIEVPYQTDIKSLIPMIDVEKGVSIIPASGLAQNFSQVVYYTLSKGGQKFIYTIKVQVKNQPSPEINLIKADTVEAGKDFSITGKNFGKFALDIQAFLVDSELKESLIKHQLIDSTQIKLNTSVEQKTGFYQIKIKVKNQEVLSAKKLWIGYPSPQLDEVLQKNMLLGDTIWLSGKYLDWKQFIFTCQLQKNDLIYQLPLSQSISNKLGFVLPKNLSIGTYTVRIKNVSENKLSEIFNMPVAVYDPNMPFIRNIIEPRATYQKSEKLVFKTINFAQIGARFYQVDLVGAQKTYIQNGIYDASHQALSVELPDQIEAGVYLINFSLFEPQKGIKYSFQTDLKISVKD